MTCEQRKLSRGAALGACKAERRGSNPVESNDKNRPFCPIQKRGWAAYSIYGMVSLP